MELVNSKQLAARLGVSRETLRRLKMRPDFPQPITATKYSWRQVEGWLERAAPKTDQQKQARVLMACLQSSQRIITANW